jgi:hypothetical protein
MYRELTKIREQKCHGMRALQFPYLIPCPVDAYNLVALFSSHGGADYNEP